MRFVSIIFSDSFVYGAFHRTLYRESWVGLFPACRSILLSLERMASGSMISDSASHSSPTQCCQKYSAKNMWKQRDRSSSLQISFRGMICYQNLPHKDRCKLTSITSLNLSAIKNYSWACMTSCQM